MIREALNSMRKSHLIGSAASALIPAEDNKTAPHNSTRKATPNARTQNRAAPHKFLETKPAAKKPAAQAFGDKFESARKFNSELKTKSDGLPKSNKPKDNKIENRSKPKSKR
jgi:hypothetical protein